MSHHFNNAENINSISWKIFIIHNNEIIPHSVGLGINVFVKEMLILST